MTVLRNRSEVFTVLYGTLGLSYLACLVRELASRTSILSTDFAAYLTGWTLVWSGDGEHLYDPAAQAAVQAHLLAPYHFPNGLLAFLNPPHVAVAFAPFATLGLVAGFRLWTALQLALAVVVARAVVHTVGVRGRAAWLLVTAVAAFWPLFYAVFIGQLSLLLTLALLRLHAALEAGRDGDRRASVWLFVLTIKPQLLPLLVVLLVVERRWRALAWASIASLGAAVASSAVLGWDVWLRYVVNLGRLESFFAQGTSDHMVTLRGLLVLLLGNPAANPFAAKVELLASWGALGIAAITLAALWRRPSATPPAAARRLALATGVGLVLSPHLFVQDVTLWIAPLAIFFRALGAARGAPAFARFALSWPLIFLGVGAYISVAGRSPAPLALIPIAAALAWIAATDLDRPAPAP